MSDGYFELAPLPKYSTVVATLPAPANCMTKDALAERGLVLCSRCYGDGWIQVPYPQPDRPDWRVRQRCPRCGGHGVMGIIRVTPIPAEAKP
jgi:DnaJ-class molecular chaperone